MNETSNRETIKFLTVKEVARLLKVIKSKRDKALVYVAYRHGLRISEARNLQWDDVNFGTMQIFTRRLKGSVAKIFMRQRLTLKEGRFDQLRSQSKHA